MAVEVEKSIAGLKDGAPGPDRVNPSTLMRVSNGDHVVHMSFWLLCECTTSPFCDGITTLVPKSSDAKDPGDYRPITVALIIARLFHRVLAMRLEVDIPVSPCQKAFRRGDGLADNVYILRSVIRPVHAIANPYM